MMSATAERPVEVCPTNFQKEKWPARKLAGKPHLTPFWAAVPAAKRGAREEGRPPGDACIAPPKPEAKGKPRRGMQSNPASA